MFCKIRQSWPPRPFNHEIDKSPIKQSDWPMSKDTTVQLFDLSLRRLMSPIVPLLDDESISEIMINGYNEIFVESGGKLRKTDVSFRDREAWQAAVRNIAQFVGKSLTAHNLSIEARLPDGSRVHIIQEPAARKGTSVAIRKFSKHKLDMNSLIEFGSITPVGSEFLGICVAAAQNIIVSGGTGSGKTTLLNCLSSMIPDGERILVLEDSSELQLQQEHVVPFEVKAPDSKGRGGIDIRELFRGSLRMRPDRVVVGECRGGEAIDMIQAMNSGHGGSMSTAHANSPKDAITRLEVMCLMGGLDIPLLALRAQICSAIDVVVQISRFHDGARKVTHISEVLPVGSDGVANVVDIFSLDGDRNLRWTGKKPSFSDAVMLSDSTDKVSLTDELWTKES